MECWRESEFCFFKKTYGVEGDWEPLEAPAGVFAYRRRAGDDERVVLLNLGDEPRAVELAGDWEVELATGPSGAGPVLARTGVLLRPAA